MSHPLEALLSRIGSPGRCQVALLFLLGLNFAIVAINHTLPGFHSYAPNHHCRVPPEWSVSHTIPSGSRCRMYLDPNNHSIGTQGCRYGYHYETKGQEWTVVTEWDLVCERRPLAPMLTSIYFFGVLAGALVFGALSDRFGRRPVMLVCLYAQGLLGIALYFASHLLVFGGLRFLQGLFMQGLQGTTSTLLFEIFSARHRALVVVVLEIYWAFGLALLAGAAFMVPNWRYLQLTLAIPTGATFLYIWIIPESIRWYLARGNVSAAQRTVQRFLMYNNKNFDKDIGTELEKISQSLSEAAKDMNTASFMELLRRPKLRRNTLVMFLAWFSVALAYYGITLHIPDLSGDRHLNFLIGAGVEVVAYLIVFLLLNRVGRRLPLSGSLLLCGAVCVAVAALSTSTDPTAKTTRTVLALLGKAFSVGCFCAVSLVAAEVFPTVVRAAAVGTCAGFARVGSLLAPQLLLLGEYVGMVVPFACVGVLCAAAGGLTLLLPETRGAPLPDSFQDAERLGTQRQLEVKPETGDVGYGKSPTWVEVDGMIVSKAAAAPRTFRFFPLYPARLGTLGTLGSLAEGDSGLGSLQQQTAHDALVTAASTRASSSGSRGSSSRPLLDSCDETPSSSASTASASPDDDAIYRAVEETDKPVQNTIRLEVKGDEEMSLDDTVHSASAHKVKLCSTCVDKKPTTQATNTEAPVVKKRVIFMDLNETKI